MSATTCTVLLALFSASEPSKEQLDATMRGNLAALVALQPLLASPAAFHDPANAATIAASFTLLSGVKHQFARPSSGPASPAASIAVLFAEAVDRARVDFATGREESARLRARGLTTLCVSCHARQFAGGDFAEAAKLADGKGLPPLERAQLFAATRQFDAALALWSEALCCTQEDRC